MNKTLSLIVNPAGKQMLVGFYWTKDAAFGSYSISPPVNAGSGYSNLTISYTASGLEPNTTYYAKSLESNIDGTGFSEDAYVFVTGDEPSFITSSPGSATANSYVTRKESVDYFQLANHPKSDKWSLIEDFLKEQYLIMATRIIDMQRVNGPKYNSTIASNGAPNQSLKFPRAQDSTAGAAYIPAQVKIATYEQAIFLLEAGAGTETRARLQADGVTSVSIGDVSESYDADAGRSLDPRSRLAPIARAILEGGAFITRVGGIVTYGRMN